MSSSHYPPSSQPHPHHATQRHRSAAAASHRAQDGYTLTHAGRQVRIGPVSFWIAVGTLIVMAVWTAGTGTYFAFKDDVLVRLIGRQAELQFAYEDRIAELRAQVDRVTSRQLLDQEQFEQKLDQLMRRQATLESRTTTLSGVADPVTTGTVKPPARTTTTDAAPAKPSPISDTVILVPPPDRVVARDSKVAWRRIS